MVWDTPTAPEVAIALLSSLDPPLTRFFQAFMISYRFKKTCRSRRVAGNHGELKKIMSSFGSAYNLQVFWVPPLHLQANILPFTHACWWQSHIACVWIFRFLVIPSSRKAEKIHFPWLENKNYHFSGVCGYLRSFAGICGRFCGAFLSQKPSLSVAFVVFANQCAFRINLGCHKAPRCSAEKILICLMHLYFPSTNGSNW